MTFSLPADMLRLGFGCARLHAGFAEKQSRHLLDAAHDAGIRYFDTARMYGSGEAEGVLGRFLRGRRQDVVLTSKAGILPPQGLMANRWCRRAMKLAGLALPALVPAAAKPRFGMFDPNTLRRSLATSLRQLRTDRLDALLLHEVDLPDLADGAVLAWLDELAAAGTIGAYGIASTRAQTGRIVPIHGAALAVVQVASSACEDGLAPLGDRRGFLTITHSVLAGCLDAIMARLTAEPAFRRRWTAETGVDPTSRDAVAALLLAEALDANPDGVVLFSSASPSRIVAAARIAREAPFGAAQLAGLRLVCAGARRGRPSPTGQAAVPERAAD
jgi:aryl-alcohol dehydrogenase-like predicted oxidoreductase